MPQSTPSPRHAAAPASADLAPQSGGPHLPARTPPPHMLLTARRCCGPPQSPALFPTIATAPTVQPAAQTVPAASSPSHQAFPMPTSTLEAAPQDEDKITLKPHRRLP